MEREDHLALIREAVEGSGRVWADLGSGEGAFTLALAGLLGPEARIYSVDRDARALAAQERAFRSRFPGLQVRFITGDLTAVNGLPVLDGVIAANSLHYVKDLLPAVTRMRRMLAPGGRLVVVEYDTERANPWVPYPLPPDRWRQMASEAGFAATRILATRPSRYQRGVYSAVSLQDPRSETGT